MRRLARHLFAICRAVSLLLCIAACVLWVRSYRFGDFGEFVGDMDVRISGPTLSVRWTGIYSSQGCFGIGFVHQSAPANVSTYVTHADGRSLVCSASYCFERYPFMSLPPARPGVLPTRMSWWNERGFCARSRS